MPPISPARFWSVVEGKYQPYWLVNSRNKLPITLNLKHPKGQKILRQMVERADVLLENMRPGTFILYRGKYPSPWETRLFLPPRATTFKPATENGWLSRAAPRLPSSA
jgi:hypothetical protein